MKLNKEVLNWSPLGRRKRGRPQPQQTWEAEILNSMEKRDMKEKDWVNREFW